MPLRSEGASTMSPSSGIVSSAAVSIDRVEEDAASTPDAPTRRRRRGGRKKRGGRGRNRAAILASATDAATSEVALADVATAAEDTAAVQPVAAGAAVQPVNGTTAAAPTRFSGSYVQAVMQQAAGNIGGRQQQHFAAPSPQAGTGRGQPARAPAPSRVAAPSNGVSQPARQNQFADGDGWRQQGAPRGRANTGRGQPNRAPRGRAGGAAPSSGPRNGAPQMPRGSAAARQPAAFGARTGATRGNGTQPAPATADGDGGSGGVAGTTTSRHSPANSTTQLFQSGVIKSFLDVLRQH